jgi:hypothetical protein
MQDPSIELARLPVRNPDTGTQRWPSTRSRSRQIHSRDADIDLARENDVRCPVYATVESAVRFSTPSNVQGKRLPLGDFNISTSNG